MSSRPLARLATVSAIVGNWNGEQVLPDCLRTLKNQDYGALEIYVVDNHSSDRSQQIVEEYGAHWIPMGTNAGLAAALNAGARASTGDYLLFLNNDMRFDPWFIGALAVALASRSDAFAVDATHFDWNHTRPTHSATILADDHGVPNSYVVAPGIRLQQYPSTTLVEVLYASGASMIVRRDAFEQLEGFNEAMFLGYEDLDLCWRARLRGWVILYEPQAICWHRESVSSNSESGSPLRLRGTVVGKLLFASQWLSVRHCGRTWLEAGVGVLKDVLSAQWRRAGIRVQAITIALRLFPTMRRHGDIAYRNAKSTPANFLMALRRIKPKPG